MWGLQVLTPNPPLDSGVTRGLLQSPRLMLCSSVSQNARFLRPPTHCVHHSMHRQELGTNKNEGTLRDRLAFFLTSVHLSGQRINAHLVMKTNKIASEKTILLEIGGHSRLLVARHQKDILQEKYPSQTGPTVCNIRTSRQADTVNHFSLLCQR